MSRPVVAVERDYRQVEIKAGDLLPGTVFEYSSPTDSQPVVGLIPFPNDSYGFYMPSSKDGIIFINLVTLALGRVPHKTKVVVRTLSSIKLT